MGLKIYKIRCVGNESTFPIEVNGERMYVTFKRRFGERLGSLSCDDVAVQRGIEGSSRFLNGEIEVEGVVALSDKSDGSDRADESDQSDRSDKSDESDGTDEAEEPVGKYDEVTRFSDARRVLNRDFGIPYSRLSNSEMVRNEAKGVGVVFRNLGTK